VVDIFNLIEKKSRSYNLMESEMMLEKIVIREIKETMNP
jgi:hypothetical protein